MITENLKALEQLHLIVLQRVRTYKSESIFFNNFNDDQIRLCYNQNDIINIHISRGLDIVAKYYKATINQDFDWPSDIYFKEFIIINIQDIYVTIFQFSKR